MCVRNTSSDYGSVAKFFHWLIFLLLFVMIIYGYCLSSIPKDYRAVAYNLHKLTGLTILILMVLRLLWALVNPKPQLPSDTPFWQRVAERTVQILFYAVIIAMPIAGLTGSLAAGRPPYIGNWQISFPMPQSKLLSEFAFGVHGILAIAIIVLFVIHVLAGFYHFFIKKDDVLQTMLPGGTHRYPIVTK